MISKSNKAARADFLKIDYDSTSFLVNRNQFVSSYFVNEFKELKSFNKYLSCLTSYNEKILFTFNLNLYLEECFKCSSTTNARLIIISNTASFSETSRQIIKKMKFSGPQQISRDLVAFLIPGEVHIEKIPLTELKLFSNCIQNAQIKKGIPGCRFPEPDKTQYFIDIDTLFSNEIISTTGTL